MSLEDMIKIVRAHALANYECDGWDYLVECWSDQEVGDILTKAGACDSATAIKACHEAVKVLGEYRDEIQSTAF